MKKILFSILALAIAVSCVKPDFEFDPETVKTSSGGTVSNVSETSISVVFSSDAGSASVNFSATADWTAQVINDRAEGWCKLSSSSGKKGSGTLNISVAQNDGYDERSATVKVDCGEVSRTILVTQKQKDALIVTAGKIELGAEGGAAEIEVKSNVKFEWELDANSKGWVSFVQTKALSSSTLVFKVEANEDILKREATVTLKSGDISEQVKIYQAGSKPAIIISKNDFAVSDQGGEIKVDVSSNVNVTYRITEGGDWLSESKTKAMSTNTFVFSATPNESYEERHAEITFTNTDNNLTEKVYVTQVQHDAIVVACDRYEVSCRNEVVTVELGHNVDYNCSIDVSWIKQVVTKSFVTDRLSFSVELNEGENSREGNITFTSKDGKISQNVKICQAQADKIIISDLEKYVSDKGGTVSIEIRSNIDYKYEIVQQGNWLHDANTKAAVSRTLNFTADPNEGYEARDAKIVVTSLDGTFTGAVTIIQMQKDALVIAGDRYDLPTAGGQISIKLGHNVDFKTEISDRWISAVQTKAFVEETLVFDIAANSSEDSREGSITFTSKDGSLKQVVKIVQAQLDQLVIGEKEKTVSDKGGEVDIEVRSNTEYAYRITQGAEWLHAVTTKGMVSKTLKFTADANTSNDYREAKVVVTSADGTLSETVTIGQVQNDALVIAKDRYDVTNEGDEFTVEVGHNVDFTYTINDSWIKESTTKAFTTSKIKFIVDVFSGEDSREGSITFKSKDGKLTQTVKVCQAPLGQIVVGETTKTISDQGETFTVEVRANVDYTYKIVQTGSWISEVTTKSMVSKTLTFKATANTAYEPRQAQIIVTSADGKLSRTVDIIQVQKDALVIAQSRYDIGPDGGSFSIKVGHNVDLDIEIADSWIHKSQTKAYTEENIGFTVDSYNGDSARESSITFKSKDGKLSQTVKVVQGQLDQLIIGETTKTVSDKGGTVDIEIKANVNYKYTITGGTWLHAATKALTTSTLSLVADANTGYNSRVATVTVTSNDGKLSQTVTVTQVQKDALVIAQDRYDIGPDGGNFSIKLGHNVDFDIEIADTWIHKAQTKAYTEETIGFTVDSYKGDSARESSITFKSKDGKLSQTVKVVQGQLDQLIIGETTKTVSDKGGTVDIEIQANVKYTYKITGGTWLHAPTKALTTSTLSLVADANTSNDYREATVTVTSTDGKLSQTVTVGQVQNDALVVAQNRYDVGPEGGNFSIKLGHNVDFDIEIADTWIHKSQTKAYTEETIGFTVDSYNGDSARESSITFKSKDGKLSQTVKVVQGQLNQLIIGETTKSISDKGGAVDIEIQANVKYKYTITGGTWLHTPTKALTTSTLSLVADANTGYNSRVATVTVTSNDGKLSQTVTVTQAQKDALVIAQDRYDVGPDGGNFSIKLGHNVDFDIEIADSWIQKVQTKAYTEENISFTVDSYNGDSARESSITFKSKDGKLSQTVKVVQGQLNQLIIGETTKSVSDKGGTVDIEIQANVKYTYKITGGTWLHAPTKALTTSTLSLVADANTEYSSREAIVTVTSSDGKLSQTVTVTQLQKDAIIAEKTAYQIGNDGGNISIVVRSNVKFTTKITEGTEWLSIPETKALSSSTVNVVVASNPAGTKRVGKIVFTLEGGTLKEEVTITQENDHYSILKVTYSEKTIQIPELAGNGLTGTIDWGDGKSDSYSAGATHTYSKSGSHTVTITVDLAQTFSTPVTGVSEIDLTQF